MSFLEKHSSIIFSAISVLSFPVMILNLAGGIVSGIWLAILGEWSALGVGIFAIFFSTFFLSLLLMPGLIFSLPGMNFLVKGNKILGYFLLLLGFLYTTAVVVGWCLFILNVFLDMASSDSIIPMLIWSYGVALAPWFYMAGKEANESSIISSFWAAVAYIVVIIMILFGATIQLVSIVFIVIMLATDGFMIFMTFSSELGRSKYYDQPYNYENEYFEDEVSHDVDNNTLSETKVSHVYCGQCGEKNDLEGKFCGNCGEKIDG